MLRGLLRWCEEGSGKGIWVFCGVGLSLRGNGTESTHTPFSLPIPNILCQTFRMRNLTATFCLTIAVLLGSAGVITSANADPCNCGGYSGPGGPCYSGPGGPAYSGPGGPAYDGPGGPCYSGPGGPAYSGPGGPAYDGPGGPAYSGPGGPAYDGPGGQCYAGPGGPAYDGPGGPCYSGPGGSGINCPSICR
jgi:hypothetical protein